jgi:hypothetical protein
MTDIGSFGIGGLGPADQVTGTITPNGNPVAIIWQDGVITRLGTGYGGAINQSGQVTVRRNTATGTIAELYTPN